MTKLNWTVFLSQSGKELYDICNLLNIVPSRVVTNNPKKMNEDVVTFLKAKGCELKTIPFKPLLEHYLQEDILNSSIITLHGYLRILPSEFISRYSPRTIYNGHPGLINYYPELKGFNQQETIYYKKDMYPWIGSVIHKVTAGVDEGEVLYSSKRLNTVNSIDDAYLKLRETSLNTWLKFFTDETLQNLQNNQHSNSKGLHWVYREES